MTCRACAIAMVAIAVASAGGPVNGQDSPRHTTARGEWPTCSGDLAGTAIGTAMTYLVDGKQYIALTVQGARQGDVPELIALVLP